MTVAGDGRADRLLQGLQGLVLHLHAISSDLPADQPTRQAMERWLLSAEALVQQGCAEGVADGEQGQVGAVALLLSLVDLERQLSAMGRPLRLRLQVGQALQPLQPGMQQALAQLACDHARRARLQAGATWVTVRLRPEPQALVLAVRDNGRWPGLRALHGVGGAEPATAAICDAARRLGARLRIWHWPGAGGELQLCLPARRAYCMPSGGA